MQTRDHTAGGPPLGKAILFALAGFPIGALNLALLVYLPPHLTRHLGVGLAAVGQIWAIVRLIDIGVDPALGLAMDRTRSPFGRYRLWLVLGAPVLMLGVARLFLAAPGVGPAYLAGWLLVFYLGMSVFSLAHPAWAATLAPSYDGRSRLFGVAAAVSVASSLAVILTAVVNARLGGSDARGVQAMGWLIIVATPLLTAAAVLAVGERVGRPFAEHPVRLADYAELLVKPDLVRLYAAQVCMTMGPGWMSALYLFYAHDVLGFGAGQASILLAVYIFAGLAGAPLLAKLAVRIGKHRALSAAAVAYSLGLVSVLALPPRSLVLTMLPMAWLGFVWAGFELIIRAMLADVADEIRLERGRERLSLVFGLNTLSAKVAAAFCIGLAFPLLQALGYVAKEGVANTPAAVGHLKWVFIAGPIVFVMLGGASVLGWRMTAERHDAVRAALEQRDSAG